EEEILPDVAHHRAAETNGFFDTAEIALQQCDTGTFHRYVGAGTHRDADISRGQCGRVVDTIAGHRNDVSMLAQYAYALVLVLRRDSGFDFIDAEFLRNGASGALVISGKHNHLEAEFVQLLDCAGR